MERVLSIETPLGPMGIAATETAVTRIFFGAKSCDGREGTALCTAENATPLLRQAADELAEYFAGTRRAFTLPLAPSGTPFQQSVWQALQSIPYGQTRSYRQIAQQIGRPAASRAVGMADNRNPIAIVIPCHRVIGSNGSLVGYAAGLAVKEQLLRLEKA